MGDVIIDNGDEGEDAPAQVIAPCPSHQYSKQRIILAEEEDSGFCYGDGLSHERLPIRGSHLGLTYSSGRASGVPANRRCIR